jgi:hypothetical protein
VQHNAATTAAKIISGGPVVAGVPPVAATMAIVAGSDASRIACCGPLGPPAASNDAFRCSEYSPYPFPLTSPLSMCFLCVWCLSVWP